jgi:NADPH2:quinone reductase
VLAEDELNASGQDVEALIAQREESQMVRAMVYDVFGGPEVLHIAEIDEPVVGPDWVLVDVAATSVNPVDTKVRQGHLRGLFAHHLPIVPGWDFAGTVRAVGPTVTHVAPGDRVFGYDRQDAVGPGTLAERISVPDRVLAKAPQSVDLDVAAAVPLAGLTAYQLLNVLAVQPGETVVVHAASGGVGHFVVQLAVRAGARVFGTCSPASASFVAELGAEPIQYGDELPERLRTLVPGGVDVVIDLYGHGTVEASDAYRAPQARVGSILDAEATKARGGVYVFVRPSVADLESLAALIDDGDLRVVIAETFAFERAADAHRQMESGHTRGKLVVRVS